LTRGPGSAVIGGRELVVEAIAVAREVGDLGTEVMVVTNVAFVRFVGGGQEGGEVLNCCRGGWARGVAKRLWQRRG